MPRGIAAAAYKRLSYSHENEVRAALWMAEEYGVDVPAHGVLVGIDTKVLVNCRGG